jgi:hypothetical protein
MLGQRQSLLIKRTWGRQHWGAPPPAYLTCTATQRNACNMSMTSTTTIAAQILSNTLAVMKTVREQAKESKDVSLKEHISDLYDSVLSLKEAVMLVTDENNELKRKIEQLQNAEKQKPELRQVGVVNYYFVGDKGPYCQACYDNPKVNRLVAMSPPENWNGGIRRYCPVHGDHVYEKEMVVGTMRLGGRRG